jgi:hypothetical protein
MVNASKLEKINNRKTGFISSVDGIIAQEEVEDLLN